VSLHISCTLCIVILMISDSNPTLHSPPLPPQSRYGVNLNGGLYRSLYGHGHGQKKRTYSHSAAVGSSSSPGRGTSIDVSRRQSWGHGGRAAQGTDYAVSVSSVGSVGE
jgi:hypothetical protein